MTVRDDGRGIPKADMTKALSRFGQVSPGTGSGLGLPIAQEAIGSFGGTLTLDRDADWFAVRIVLPACRTDQTSRVEDQSALG